MATAGNIFDEVEEEYSKKSSNPFDEIEKENEIKYKSNQNQIIDESQREDSWLSDFTADSDFERMQTAGESRFLKGVSSGATLGASEYIPGMDITENDFGTKAGKFIGAAAPIGGFLKLGGVAAKPLVTAASKSPFAAKQLASAANLLGVGIGGAGYGAAESLIGGKIPSVEELGKDGAIWMALDAGLGLLGKTGQFTAQLLKRSKQTGKPSFEVLNDLINTAREEGIDISRPDRVAAKALSILEKDIPQVTESKALENVTKFEKDVNIPKAQRVETIFNELGQSRPVDKQFGEFIQKSVAEAFEAAESKYKPIYNTVGKLAEKIKYSDKDTIQLAQQIVKEINALKTKPQNYDRVVNTLKDVITDLGYEVRKVGEGIKILDKNGKEIDLSKIVYNEIPLSKGIELGRRLNQIIDYDIPEKSIRDRLKPVTRSVKKNIRTALGTKSPLAEQMFDRAEKMYGETAEKFGRDSIGKLRQVESTESIVKQIDSPTTLDDLRRILPQKDFNDVERKLIESWAEKSPKQIRENVRQFEPYLSAKGKQAANKLAQAKETDRIINQLIKEDGKIDFAKLKQLKKDPEFLKQVEELGGKEAVDFIKNLETFQKEMETNLGIVSKMEVAPAKLKSESIKTIMDRKTPKNALEKFLRYMEKNGIKNSDETALKVILAYTAGLPKTVAYLGGKFIYNVIKNRKARNTYMDLLNATSPKSFTPEKFKAALTAFTNELVPQDENDER